LHSPKNRDDIVKMFSAAEHFDHQEYQPHPLCQRERLRVKVLVTPVGRPTVDNISAAGRDDRTWGGLGGAKTEDLGGLLKSSRQAPSEVATANSDSATT
jgi:hypothetical protein